MPQDAEVVIVHSEWMIKDAEINKDATIVKLK